MRIALVLPHIYAHPALLKSTIFAPVHLALSLAEELKKLGHEVTIFSPGQISDKIPNETLDLKLLEAELAKEQCSLTELAHKNPLAFVSMSRELISELTAKAFAAAKSGAFDLIHIFLCESEIPLYFAAVADVPTVFTHHDPYNFYRGYRVRFPRVKNLNYVAISDQQRQSAPSGLNFVGTVYNGLDTAAYKFSPNADDHFAFLGRIVRNKGCHHAIAACVATGSKLKIAGKHYDTAADPASYWSKYIEPHLDQPGIEYVGFLQPGKAVNEFLASAKALLFPVEWDEPFGMVMIEAMAAGTPVIAFDRGAARELIVDGVTGFIVKDVKEMQEAMQKIDQIDRSACRTHVEKNFSSQKMASGYAKIYQQVTSY